MTNKKLADVIHDLFFYGLAATSFSLMIWYCVKALSMGNIFDIQTPLECPSGSCGFLETVNYSYRFFSALIVCVFLYLYFLQKKTKFSFLRKGDVELRNATVFFLICFVVYSIVAVERNWEPSPTPQHRYFAEAFTEGRLGINVWLEETRMSNGMFYILHGPIPAVVMMPLAYFFGNNFNDNLVMMFLASVSGGLFMLTLFRLKNIGHGLTLAAVWRYSILFTFGTLILAYSTNGRYWYITQMTSIVFIVLYLWSILGGKNPILTGVFIGLAALGRYHTMLLGVVYYLYLIYRRDKLSIRLRNAVLYTTVLLVFVVFILYYNFVRYNNPYDFGYSEYQLGKRYLLDGYFKFNKLFEHMAWSLLGLPVLTDSPPFFKIYAGGLSVFITTPLFLYLLRLDYDTPLKKSLIYGSMPFLLTVLCFESSGWTQFGYRFLMELTPVFVLLLASADDRIKKNWFYYLLFILGVAVNLFGALTFQRKAYYEYFFYW